MEAAEGRLPLWMTKRLFGYEAIRLAVGHGPWSVNLVDFQQHVLFSLGPHITVPILAFHSFDFCALFIGDKKIIMYRLRPLPPTSL